MSYIDEKHKEYEAKNTTLTDSFLEEIIATKIFVLLKKEIDFAIMEGKNSISLGLSCDDGPSFDNYTKEDYMTSPWSGFYGLTLLLSRYDYDVSVKIEEREAYLSTSHIIENVKKQLTDLGVKNVDITLAKVSKCINKIEHRGLWGHISYKKIEQVVSSQKAWRLYVSGCW